MTTTQVGDDRIRSCLMCRRPLVRGPGGVGRRFVLVGDPPRRIHATCAETWMKDRAEDAVSARPRDEREREDR